MEKAPIASRNRRIVRIALATCRRLPEPDPDQRPLLLALRELGAKASPVAWDDPDARLDGFDVCVLRSTWNYVHHLPAFLAWCRRTSRITRLENPLDVVRWNVDKSYLQRLDGAGIRTVPTAYFPKDGTRRLGGVLNERGWTEFVVKPRIGAGSFMTRRFSKSRVRNAEAFLRSATAERAMMVQPYVTSVDTYGERSIIAIGGRLTHAIRKRPRLHDQKERVSASIPIADDERRFAGRALSFLGRAPLYARIDVARDETGGLMLMEFELVEPSLFLLQEPKALKLFARACVAAAGGQGSRKSLST